MTTAAALNLIALVAMLVARAGIARSARHSAVRDRLRAFYGAAAALLALRLVTMIVSAAAPLVMIAAAWLPYLLLRLAEEMMRRHAPRPVKLFVLGGAVAFSVLAVTLGFVWSGLAIGLLAAFQAFSVTSTIVFLLRDRRSISVAERQAAILLAVTLVGAVLLSLTDFKAVFPALEVRGGPFAVSLLLLATSRLATGRGRIGYLLFDLLVALTAGALMFALVTDQHGSGAVPLAAVTVALIALVIAIERFVGLRAHDAGVAAALASAGPSRADLLAAHPLLARGRIVTASRFADYPDTDRDLLARTSLVSFDVADRDPAGGAAMRDLLQRNAATHLVRLSSEPLTFLAIAGDGFAQGSLDDELLLAARLMEGST